MSDIEKQYERLYANDTKERVREEFDRLCRLYYEKLAEFKKASKIRWLLTFVGFLLVFFFVLIQGDIKSLFQADIISVFWMLVVATILTGFYFFISVSIFGWLFQKDIAEGRRLDDIKKGINVLEKLLKK